MLADFVLEVSSNPGRLVQVPLAGSPAGRRTWASVFSNGAPVFYFMDDGQQAEWGNGTFNSGPPSFITRASVIGNTSGTQALLNFTISTNVYNEIPAERMAYVDDGGVVRLPNVPGQPGTIIGSLYGAAPVGGSMDYWGATPPAGWLWCNGQAVSRTTYSRLYAALGGAASPFGQTSTTFNLPDLRGVGTAGRDAMGAADSGRLNSVFGVWHDTLGALTGSQYTQYHGHPMYIADPTHAHSVYDPGHAHVVYDVGHAHLFSYVRATLGAGQGIDYGIYGTVGEETRATDTRGTGISVNSGYTGVAIYAAATGLLGDGQTTRYNGAGAIGSWVAEYGSGSCQNVQPTALCNKIIFAGA